MTITHNHGSFKKLTVTSAKNDAELEFSHISK